MPTARYEFATWKSAKANIDQHVELDDHYYSVPYQLVREAVEIRATARVVEIFRKGRRVASDVREYGRKRFLTKPEHMPASLRAIWNRRRPSWWRGAPASALQSPS